MNDAYQGRTPGIPMNENDRCVERFLGQTQRLRTRPEIEPGGRL